MLEQQIEQDLKAALLAGDKTKATTLRGLKAVLLNVKVATGKRETGLSDEEVLVQLSKQSKQRQESADLYLSAGDKDRGYRASSHGAGNRQGQAKGRRQRRRRRDCPPGQG